MRHLGFSQYVPSTDGDYWIKRQDIFEMELTEESHPSDVPLPIAPPSTEEELPDVVRDLGTEPIADATAPNMEVFNIQNVTLTQLLSLYGMEEETAVRIKALVDEGKVSQFEDLQGYDFITDEQRQVWSKSFITVLAV